MNKRKCWATCEDCKHREMLFRHEFERRFYPRCSHCGGWLRISDNAWKDAVGIKREARELNDQFRGH
jgi:acetyl-CoA carboxylase beta subunit